MKKLSLILVAFLFAGVVAQETVREIRRETKKVIEEENREKKMHGAEKQRDQQFRKSSEDKLRRIKQQKSLVKSQTDSLKQELSRLYAARKKLKGGAYYYTKRKEDFGGTIAKRVDSIIPLIEQDFPYKREETVKTLQELSSQMQRKVISPEEGLGRLWDLLLERIRLGYTAETYSGYLNLSEGQAIPGKFLRYGTVFSLFVSQDGENIYFLQRDKEGDFAWKSAGKDIEFRRSLKFALKVAEGKAAPQLVSIPLPVTILEEVEK